MKNFLICFWGVLQWTGAAVWARDFDIRDYGAKDDGTKCTAAFETAVVAAEAAGTSVERARVVVPAGTWFTGAIHLRSNTELHLDDGATVLFSQDPNDYLPAVETSWEGMECWNYSPLVYAYGCTNIAITGSGTLKAFEGEWKDTTWSHWVPQENGIRAARRKLYDWSAQGVPVSERQIWKMPNAHTRPHLLQLNRCKGIRLSDFKVCNSPFWTIHLYHSEDAVVSGLDVFAHGGNNDGIDIEMTRDVVVENCRFDQGDDGIVIKSGRNQDAWRLARPTENVVVRNCKVVNGHGLFVVGSEISGGVRNIMIENCTADDVRNVFYVKTNRRRGGVIENVRMKDCKVRIATFAAVCVETDVLYGWAKFPTYEERLTKIRNLRIDNLSCEKSKYGVYLKGDKDAPVEDVLVNGLDVKQIEVDEPTVENVKGFVYVPKREPNCGVSEQSTVEARRILWYGNSYSKYGEIPERTAALAELAGYPRPLIVADLHLGKTLAYHTNCVTKTPELSISNLAMLACGTNEFDDVVIQGNSLESTDSACELPPDEKFIPDALALYRLVRESERGGRARAVLYQTWARHQSHSRFYPFLYKFPADMQREITKNYRRLKTVLDGAYGERTAIISPVGEAFLRMENSRSLYASDLHHQGGRGYELIPMVMFSCIYGVFVGDCVTYELALSSGWTTQTEAEWHEMLIAVKEVLYRD